MLIECLKNQEYPKEKIEWIVIDDGTDKVEDLLSETKHQHQLTIKYYKSDKKLPLGKKRNMGNKLCTGEIIVYMDDDDYYPPTRISHAVETLQANPTAMCVGSSEMYLYFSNLQKMYKFGPYGKTHSTAATLAFRWQLVMETAFDDEAAVAEEKVFLKNYTVPLVQLDSMKTILVFSHIHNSFDKNILLKDAPSSAFIKETDVQVKDFIKEELIYHFFMTNMVERLQAYEPGLPKNKPDVEKQIESIQLKRETISNQHQEYMNILKKLNIDPKAAFIQQENQTMIHAEKKIQEMSMVINDLLAENKQGKQKIAAMERQITEFTVDIALMQDKVDYYEKKLRNLKIQVSSTTAREN
jgi:glycosyltransferase involved in cell wall biosynthesis